MAEIVTGDSHFIESAGIRILGTCEKCGEETPCSSYKLFLPHEDDYGRERCFLASFKCPCGERWAVRLY